MIDLHIHTNNSDGLDTVDEVLKKANNLGLEVISITDHDTCKAYKELNKNDFKGKIITGCEFTTSYKGVLIEVLGYGIKLDLVQRFLDSFYNEKLLRMRFTVIYNRLLDKIKELDLKMNLNILNKGDISFYKVYRELIKDCDNIKKVNEDIFNTYVDFYRKGIYNPRSKLFLNHVEFTPDLECILNIIHSSGGKAFLAHPFIYKISDLNIFLNSLYNEHDIDGIECFYTTFSKEETEYLLNFAHSRNLLISGGTDYHGEKRKGHELGVGDGSLKVLKKTISNWNVNYFN